MDKSNKQVFGNLCLTGAYILIALGIFALVTNTFKAKLILGIALVIYVIVVFLFKKKINNNDSVEICHPLR